MKNIIFYCLFLSGVIALASCQLKKTYNTYEFAVDLQSGYKDDYVRIEIDGQKVLQSLVSTNDHTGLANHFSLNLTEGDHTIMILINNMTIAADRFHLSKNKYAAINYYPVSGQITFSYANERYDYD